MLGLNVIIIFLVSQILMDWYLDKAASYISNTITKQINLEYILITFSSIWVVMQVIINGQGVICLLKVSLLLQTGFE